MHMVCQEHESAYWDGSKGVCCDGNVYQPDTEDTSYACCPTGKEVSIVQGKENLNHCCSEGQKAYWNGSSAQCCATTTHQIVTNYRSGQTDTAYACCETKEDDVYDNGRAIISWTGYTIAGAVNGSCCSSYTSYAEDDGSYVKASYDVSIRQNGGVYYCAYTGIINGVGDVYVSDNKVCSTGDWGATVHDCRCSDSGDPQSNGTSC